MTTSTEREDVPDGDPAENDGDGKAAPPVLGLGLLRKSFGRGFWGFAVFAGVSAVLCYVIRGPEEFAGAVEDDIQMLLDTLPRVIAAMAVAGLIWVMLPRDRLTRLIGSDSGLRGLVVGTIAGIVTPGGPSSAFSLLAILGGAGADRGALVAYITAWSMLGLQRILVWDVPFMGAEFSLTRFLVCLPLPVLAGLLARRLPFAVVLADPLGGKGRRL